MSQQLSYSDIETLRRQGLLTEQEIAVKNGDIILAENVVTKARRVIDASGLMLESNRRILKG
jgi:hypothetical protein